MSVRARVWPALLSLMVLAGCGGGTKVVQEAGDAPAPIEYPSDATTRYARALGFMDAGDDRRCGLDDFVRAILKELVVPGVDDEEVGLVGHELFHEKLDAVARIADAPRVDYFPLPVRIYGRKELPQPATERGSIIVGPSIGR